MLNVTRQYHQVISLSDLIDLWRARVDAAWREGYAAAEAHQADSYARGLVDGASCRKRAEHDLVEAARLELARWGPGGRARFGDPRPGDFPGRGVRA